MNRNKCILRAALSAVIFLLTANAFTMMMLSKSESTLILKGLDNLRYFTLDSNVLMGFAALTDLIFVLRALGGKRMPVWVETLFYTGTAAVTLTFLTVAFFLGPMYGYRAMLGRSNLYFHLITPLLSIISLCFLHRGRFIRVREVFISMLPMILYGIYYTSLVLINGIDFPRTDWYNFAAGGMKTVPFVILIMFAATFAISFVLRLACGGMNKKYKTKEN